MPNIPMEQEIINLVFAYAIQRTKSVAARKLAHYTTADNAMKIISGKQLWLRNARVMNDFSEIAHGKECLFASTQGPLGKRFWELLEIAHPGAMMGISAALASADETIKTGTYMTSLSEHDADDNLGRLSMWRAYGGPVSGVALVLNSEFTDDDDTHVPVYPSPVLYEDKDGFAIEFEAMVNRLEANKATLAAAPKITVMTTVARALMFSMMSCKHKGFKEEEEWRLIHLPRMGEEHAFVPGEVESIRGIPQIVYKLPLYQAPEIGDISLSRLLHKIIIGPTLYPAEIRDAFIDLLMRANIPDASNKVVVSDIPLRQWG